ncbi:MAG TPA: ParB N-terminal domain-containing protein [Oscillospiraceae bacterium]|nr:ParB N-terminal domain-containing protein [Oscillospiraceae bacterium]
MAIQAQKLPSLEEAYAGTLFGATTPINPDEKKVVMVDPSELIEIEDQPFHPYPPYRLAELAEDIKENGQINPCTVRQLDGKKFILAGRNRKKACELAGLKVACIFIECDDATANLILVNSNLNQRQKLLPSELAFAYKLQKESYEAKGQKKSTAAVAEENNENVKKIQRYIKLTDLLPELFKMVDDDQLPVMVGYELSYLSLSNMESLFSYLSDNPKQDVSVFQAKELRDYGSEIAFTTLWLSDFFAGRILPEQPQDLGSLKRFSYRDKVFFIQEDKENPKKYAAYFTLGNSEALRLGTIPDTFGTPAQAESALIEYAAMRGYVEIGKVDVPESEPTAEHDPSDEHNYDTSLPFQQEQETKFKMSGASATTTHNDNSIDYQEPEPTEESEYDSGRSMQTNNNPSMEVTTSPLPTVPNIDETDIKSEPQINDASANQQLSSSKRISEEQIMKITNNLMRDKFLDGWPEWPILVEVPEIQLTVREIVLPDCKRIVSLEYGKIKTSYRNSYFQLLNVNEGINPFNDLGRANIIEHLKNLRMEYAK